jgi:type IV pilus assembly protein PilW
MSAMPVRSIAPIRIRGFTLVELMIAITLSLLIVGGLVSLFVGSSKSARELDATNRQIENGKYALQVLQHEFQHAGYLSFFNPNRPDIATPATVPDPCATALADLVAALPIHIQGSDGVPAWSCLTDAKAGSDVVVIRRASVCITGSSADCPVETGVPYFQASSCQSTTQLGSPQVTNHYRLVMNRALLDRQTRKCDPTVLEGDRRYRIRIFYIANNYQAGDGIPTLVRVELGSGGFGAPVPVAPGIETMQLEYGIDTNGDGAPDAFDADPNTRDGCDPADCAQFWRNVVAVKAYLLARSEGTLTGQTDTKEFRLGLDAAQNEVVILPTNDGYRRNVYSTLARLNNPSMRREGS